MEFKIKKSVLTKVLNNVQRGTASKTTTDILEGIKIDVYKDRLIFIGSDSNLTIQAKLETTNLEHGITVIETGSMVVKGRFFIEIIRKLPGEEVTIRTKDKVLVQIVSEQADFTINAYDPNNYPSMVELNEKFSLQIKGCLLKNMIEQTIVSVFKKESRPILTGVQFFLDDHQLKTVATDSHRLSQRIIPLDKVKVEGVAQGESISVVVPAKSLQEVTRIIEDEEDVHLVVDETKILFQIQDYAIYSRILEGIYPETSRLIPKNYQTKITVAAKDLEDGADRVALLANNEEQESVCLSISSEKVLFHSSQQQVGKMEEILQIKEFSGEDVAIHFNPIFLMDAVRTFKGVDISLYFNGSDKPFFMEEANPSNSIPHNFIQLITPIRTHS